MRACVHANNVSPCHHHHNHKQVITYKDVYDVLGLLGCRLREARGESGER